MRGARFSVGSAVFVLAAAGFAATTAPRISAPALASPFRDYALKLSSIFTPQSPTIGSFLKVRIDGGSPLRLLLDSGAQQIVLDTRAAALSGRSSGSTLELVGIGASAKLARRVASGTVEIGSMLAVDGQLLEGIDGVIPMSLSSGFLVQLDVPGKLLDLDPYPTDPPFQDDGYFPARTDGYLLFLPARLDESRSGYVLLDTGTTYSAVSPAVAGAWKNYRILSPIVSLATGTGATEGFLLPPGARFRFGARVLSADPAVVIDLSDISNHYRFEIVGILGYPPSAVR